jgi:hypothetical protein
VVDENVTVPTVWPPIWMAALDEIEIVIVVVDEPAVPIVSVMGTVVEPPVAETPDVLRSMTKGKKAVGTFGVGPPGPTTEVGVNLMVPNSTFPDTVVVPLLAVNVVPPEPKVSVVDPVRFSAGSPLGNVIVWPLVAMVCATTRLPAWFNVIAPTSAATGADAADPPPPPQAAKTEIAHATAASFQ